MIPYVESSVETDEILASTGKIPPQQQGEVSQQQIQEIESLREENSRLAKELEFEKEERKRIETTLSSEKAMHTKEITELKVKIQEITDQRDGVEEAYQQYKSNDHSEELADTLSKAQKELDDVFFPHCNNN